MIAILFSPAFSLAETPMDLAGLSHLLADHQPRLAKGAGLPVERFERSIVLTPGAEPTVFLIPGFNGYGCNECHDPEDLVQKAAARMGEIVSQLAMTSASPPPLRQYIIQPYADGLLQAHQFAHATFDTIRLFPRTIIIDTKIYGNATQHHETLHLGQTFFGHANELEAYSLNIRSDPRFLLLHFPYFSNVTGAFFVKEYETILQRYFSWSIDENTKAPREVQFYMQPFDKNTLERLAGTVGEMDLLLREVTRLNRSFPLQVAYLSEQTGIPSLLLDIAAARLLPPLPSTMDGKLRQTALATLAGQMERTDNTRLGYRIDRRKEALLTIRHQLKSMDRQQEWELYFGYLKRRFVKEDGSINLFLSDQEDFRAYVNSKLEDIRKLQQYPGITRIEQQAGERVIQTIKKELSAH